MGQPAHHLHRVGEHQKHGRHADAHPKVFKVQIANHHDANRDRNEA